MSVYLSYVHELHYKSEVAKCRHVNVRWSHHFKVEYDHHPVNLSSLGIIFVQIQNVLDSET